MQLTQKALGRSGLSLPVLGFGGSRIVNNTVSEINDCLISAFSAGMTYLDTAPFYGLGQSEHLLGDALQGIRQPYLISTKIGRLLRTDSAGHKVPIFDYSFEGAQVSLNESLQRLRLDAVDMAILHDVSARWHGEKVDQVFESALKGAYKAMERWRYEGVVKAIGIGINDCRIAQRALAEADFDFIMLAGRTTLLDQQGFDTVLPNCETKKVGLIAAAPFNSGILASGNQPGALFFSQKPPPEITHQTQQIEALCALHQVPMRAAALQLPLSHPAMTCVLAGYENLAQVLNNIALSQFPIPTDFWWALHRQSLLTESALAIVLAGRP